MSYLFPLAALLNTSAITALLIGLGLAGRVELAADVGIVQGAMLALFYAFSANARNIILNPSSGISASSILAARLVLLVPLGGLAFVLSVYLTNVEAGLALVLIFRRCSEWLGEVHLSEMEYRRNRQFAIKFIFLQSVLLASALGWILSDAPLPLWGLYLWALLPLILSLQFIGEHFRSEGLVIPAWVRLLPHFGSTAITGITVYIFRLLILLLVGKALAGDLYTAFAVGGIMGSLFAQGFGPSITLHEERSGHRYFPSWLTMLLALSAVAGTLLVLASTFELDSVNWTGKSHFFWGATGFSMVGGVLMVLAQRLRLRLLQHYQDQNVFGPDVMINILIVACVPYLYYLVGRDALMALYLINSTLALVFYFSEERVVAFSNRRFDISMSVIRQLIAILLFFPLFFQLSGAVFRDSALIFDSGGLLLQLPIPFSVLGCYGGILLLGGYKRANLSLWIIFLSFVLMLVTSIMLTHGRVGEEKAKLILLIQFILPMFALVLGQIYEATPDAKQNVAKACLYVVALVIPLQLVATWIQELPLLSSYLYVFSVYQHLQYVPVILVSAFLIACFSLWQEQLHRIVLMALAIPIGAYAMLSLSMLTIVGLLIGSVLFVAYRHLHKRSKDQRGQLLLLIMIATGIYGAMAVIDKNLDEMGKAEQFFETLTTAQVIEDNVAVMDNVSEKVNIWKFYIDEIASTGNEWAFGHQRPPDRKLYLSAHNYYLDFIYNFGLIAFVPILWLMVFTIRKIGRHWKEITADPFFVALTGAVLFLLLVDNFVKVGLRQAYPGIVTFFLWGVLLSKLSELGRAAAVHREVGSLNIVTSVIDGPARRQTRHCRRSASTWGRVQT